MYKELILTKELNHAALEAKKAVQTYEKLKSQILQLKQYKLSKQKPKNNFRNRKFGLLPISENKEHDNEIIKIQSIVRMFVAKMKYKKAKASFIRNQR